MTMVLLRHFKPAPHYAQCIQQVTKITNASSTGNACIISQEEYNKISQQNVKLTQTIANLRQQLATLKEFPKEMQKHTSIPTEIHIQQLVNTIAQAVLRSLQVMPNLAPAFEHQHPSILAFDSLSG